VVEFDLQGQAMWPGKKGFDRLVYASKNALAAPMTWLFVNLGESKCLSASRTIAFISLHPKQLPRQIPSQHTSLLHTRPDQG
jgi:hypothetical protein